MRLRGVQEIVVRGISNEPDQVIKHEDKTIYQPVIIDAGRQYLIRIFVNYIKVPNMIITVYKTPKIDKYYKGNL